MQATVEKKLSSNSAEVKENKYQQRWQHRFFYLKHTTTTVASILTATPYFRCAKTSPMDQYYEAAVKALEERLDEMITAYRNAEQEGQPRAVLINLYKQIKEHQFQKIMADPNIRFQAG